MGTVLKWHNVPRIPFRPSFGRGPVSTLSSGLQFSSKTMSLSRKEHHTGTAYSRIGLTRYLYSKENSVCYTGFRPKHALSDPKDSVSFVDDFVNMIAPWEIARYCNTEIFWYFFTLFRLSPFRWGVHSSLSTYLVCDLFSLFQIYLGVKLQLSFRFCTIL